MRGSTNPSKIQQQQIISKIQKNIPHQVIAWKYKVLFDSDISRGTLTAMAGLIVLAIKGGEDVIINVLL